MPASRRRANPRPATRSSGSPSATTTRRDARGDQRSVHGGVLPWWSHGSSVTYAVAPRARSPAARSAADLGVRAGRERPGRALADDLAVAGDRRSRPRATARCDGARRGRARSPARISSSSRMSSRLVARSPFGPRGAATTTRARERGTSCTLSHPDSHRRPRSSTWSAPRWLRGVRGLSPPVGTCTQPRGLQLSRSSVTPVPQNCNVFYFRSASEGATCDASVGVAAGEEVEGVRGDREQDLEALDRAGRGARAGCRSAPAPRVPATPRDSMPKPRPSPSLARRIASAIPGASRSITARVPSGVRSRGPNPVPPVVTTRPAKPSAQLARARRRPSSTPSAVTRCVDDLVARGGQLLDERAPALVVARAVGDAVGDGEHLGPQRHRRTAARIARAAAAGSSAPKMPVPDTRMSTPGLDRERARCRS